MKRLCTNYPKHFGTILAAAALLLAAGSLALAHDSQNGGGMMGGGQMMGSGAMQGGGDGRSSVDHDRDDRYEHRMMHGGMMHGGMMHGGMMHGGMMHGGMMQGPDGELRTFTLEEIETLMAAKLVLEGNPRLKVGSVSSGGENQAVVEIVTQEGALVDRIAVDRQTLRSWRQR